MKVKMPDEYRSTFTLENVDQAKVVIRAMKYDNSKVADYAAMACREAIRGNGDFLDRVIECSAEVSKNCRIWNEYGEPYAGEDSGYMDVLISAIAKTCFGFVTVEAYLTDIWQTGAEDYKDKMFVRYFKICEELHPKKVK